MSIMNCDANGFTLQDILFIIGLHERSGELELESGNNIGLIHFYKGKILHASSPYSRAIGDLLVEDGVISELELIETLKRQKTDERVPLGSMFLKSGKVSFEVIEMMVHDQIRNSLKEFERWSDFKFRLSIKDIKPFDRIHLTVYEFILPETLDNSVKFVSKIIQPANNEVEHRSFGNR